MNKFFEKFLPHKKESLAVGSAPEAEKSNENNTEEEINIEAQEFKENIDKLQAEIKSLGNQEEIEAALQENPSIASRILERVPGVAVAVTIITGLGGGSLSNAFETGDIKKLAGTLVALAVSSVAISGIIEFIKSKKADKKTFREYSSADENNVEHPEQV
ncbi:MAG: hypothetical protein WCW61_00645 [Patescibacteria group bacterium]|jgi:hypothetical protein